MKRIGLILAVVMMLAAAGCAKTAPRGAKTETAANGATPGAVTASPRPTDGPLSTDSAAIENYTKNLQNVASKDFTLKDLNGKEWKLSDLKGKTVLLNFWATWCGPCQNEMPEFQKLYDRVGADGSVVILAVASSALEQGGADEAKKAVTDFIKQQGFTFPVLFDADGTVWNTYQQEGIPANYIIDTQGNVRLLQSGMFRGEDDIYAALEAVRKAESGK